MNNIYRKDGWVKTTLGPAIPGAQIWVCTQPANSSALPPSPLAFLFSDPGGLVPITQPIITDGFGHYDYYVAPGLYTEIVAFGGKVQQSYPDQSIGNVGTGSGSSIVFSTNGTPNFNQLAMDLVQGVGITIVTDNLGNTTITGAVSPTMTNTVGGLVPTPPNSAAQFLNGAGAFSTPPAGISLPTHGFFLGSQDVELPVATSGTSPASRNNANEVGVALLVLLESATITSASIYVTTGGSSGYMYSGIYSYDGNTKLVDAGGLNVFSNSQIVRTGTFSSVTLPAGCYWYAWGQDSTGGSVAGKSLVQGWQGLANAVTIKFGYAANAITGAVPYTSAGVLPATLGTITPYAYADTNCNVPEVMFQ